MSRGGGTRGLAMLAALVLVYALGCAAARTADGTSDLHHEWETSLIALDELIERRETDGGVPASALVEARELRNAAAELYLTGSYRVALELIDDAMLILRKTT